MPPGVYPRRPATARFWERVNKNGPVPEAAPYLGNCWLWTASLSHAGYGRFCPLPSGYVPAHRWAYEQENGPLPEGLECDHLCRTPSCIRPSHIEAVTHRENLLRGQTVAARSAQATHCPQGHPYDEANTYVCPRGKRQCRQCRREANRRCELRKAKRLRGAPETPPVDQDGDLALAGARPAVQ